MFWLIICGLKWNSGGNNTFSPAGVFITHGDVGVGTIVGSAVFNILCIVGVCGLFAGQVSKTLPFVEFSCLYLIGLHEQVFEKKNKKEPLIKIQQRQQKMSWQLENCQFGKKMMECFANSKCFQKVQLQFRHAECAAYRGSSFLFIQYCVHSQMISGLC